jgi:hypothetical protein
MFLENVNGFSYILDDLWVSNSILKLFSDSAGSVSVSYPSLILMCKSSKSLQQTDCQSEIIFSFHAIDFPINTLIKQWVCARALPAGRAFSRRLYLACDRARKPHHLIKITKAKQSDILTWKMVLENFNGFSYILHDSWVSNSVL